MIAERPSLPWSRRCCSRSQVVRNAAVERLAEREPADGGTRLGRSPGDRNSLGDDRDRSRSRDRDKPVAAVGLRADRRCRGEGAAGARAVPGSRRSGSACAATGAGASARSRRRSGATRARCRPPISLPTTIFARATSVAGLREIAALARLSPNGGAAAVAYLIASMRRTAANWPRLRALFGSNPQLARPVARLRWRRISEPFRRAPRARRRAHETRESRWLAAAARYADQGRAIIPRRGRSGRARAGRSARRGELLHDRDFRDSASPPPFNWALTSSTVGLAERQPGGRLHVLFYGQEDGDAGEPAAAPCRRAATGWHAGSSASSARAHALTWSLWCDKARSRWPRSRSMRPRRAAGTFEVPAGLRGAMAEAVGRLGRHAAAGRCHDRRLST